MPRPPSARTPDRRRFLGGATAVAAAAVAGCLDGLLGSSGSATFEPQALSDPPEGTPGELHYAIEERIVGYDLRVESVYETDGDLVVAYHSDAASSGDDDEAEAKVGASGETDDDETDDGGAHGDETDGETDDGDETDDGGTDDETDDGDGANDDGGADDEADGEATDDEAETEPGDVMSVVRSADSVFNHTLAEAGAIADLFNEILVKHGDGADYGLLVGEIENPLPGQPHGWGAMVEWFEAYNAGEMTEMELMLSISQLVVYEEDLEDVG